MAHHPVAVSAPGKVLLAGGYLVLDRAYTGLVIGLSARIHVIVRPRDDVDGKTIVVSSPQFERAVWEYGFEQVDDGGGVKVTQLKADADSDSRNPFVETTLNYALTYIASLTSSPLPSTAITILADNDYYSHPTTTHPTRFLTFPVPLPAAHKTGLGSSAALVTALTAALLTHHLPPSTFSLSSPAAQSRLHNLAQAAHCAAQGKIGSGFDVAAAVHGSCLYRRFSPAVLADLGDAGTPRFADRVRRAVDDDDARWDVEVRKEDGAAVPRGLRLVMCDVDGGTKTPGMVARVLGWRAGDGAVAEALWRELQGHNEALAGELRRLAEGGEAGGYAALRSCIEAIRALTRKMSGLAGVPIEPAAQTRLLDACARVEGVVGGVVPGAGGFDAVAVLVEDREEVLDRLKGLVAGWVFDDGTERAANPGRVKILDVREEMEGVKAEGVEQYREWLS